MIYLKEFNILNENQEINFITSENRTCFNNYYPFGIFPVKKLETIEFGNITIFYGENGSGKSTLLNIIADKILAKRGNKYEKSEFFETYVKTTKYTMSVERPEEIKIITSDDVFNYLFDIRAINNGVDRKREHLFNEYLDNKYTSVKNTDDYERLKEMADARKKTMSTYVRERLRKNNLMEQSNGESALMYFESEISGNSLYILDEPENSLSASSIIKLVKFIEESSRFYNCQFIISTHSPFILSLKDAVIYDLDSIPSTTKKWSELQNVMIYRSFFEEHKSEFK